MARFKIPRGVEKRKNTVHCKSVYSPKDQKLREIKDIVQCSVDIAEETPDNINRIEKGKPLTTVPVSTFQIEIDTAGVEMPQVKDYSIKVKNLCSSKNTECEDVFPSVYMEKFVSLLPKNVQMPQSVYQQISPQQMPQQITPILITEPIIKQKPLTAPPPPPGGSKTIKILSVNPNITAAELHIPPQRKKTPEEIKAEKEKRFNKILSKHQALVASISSKKDEADCMMEGASITISDEKIKEYQNTGKEVPETALMKTFWSESEDSEPFCNAAGIPKNICKYLENRPSTAGYSFDDSDVSNCKIKKGGKNIKKDECDKVNTNLKDLRDKGGKLGNVKAEFKQEPRDKKCTLVHKDFGPLTSMPTKKEACEKFIKNPEIKKMSAESDWKIIWDEKRDSCRSVEKKDAK